MASRDLFGRSRAEIGAALERLGAAPFHRDQVFRWLYGRGVTDPALWTDLPKSLRERIASEVTIRLPRIAAVASASDGTIKYGMALPAGGTVETVYMVQRDRVTLCLSSQVGCALDCDFCLTAKMGFVRHLDAGEIAGQVALVRADRKLDGPFNVVFMGMGEPLHNYDNVLAAFRLLIDRDGFGLSRRRVTVSTSGLAPAIERLAEEPVRPKLAVSLNATTDAVRDRIMPVNRKYPIARLIEACRRFARATGERFTFEYVVLAGLNDSDADVARLRDILRKTPAKLNLIPFNPVPGWLAYTSPPRERIVAIRDRLLGWDLPVSIRWSRGVEARAACGQLALLPDAPKEARA
jgi:23S rRNA (adenine2503-C2)-methyltransferase